MGREREAQKEQERVPYKACRMEREENLGNEEFEHGGMVTSLRVQPRCRCPLEFSNLEAIGGLGKNSFSYFE